MRLKNFSRLSLILIATGLLSAPTIVFAAPITNGGPGGIGDTTGSSSLRLWLRGDVGVLTSGSSVTQWVDQSGNATLVVPNAPANRPTYTGSQNAIPVVTFNPGNPSVPTVQFLRAAPTFTVGGTGSAVSYAAYRHYAPGFGGTDQAGLPFFARSPVNYFGLHANNNSPTSVTAYTGGGGSTPASVNGTVGGTFTVGTWGTIQGTHAAVATGAAYTDFTFGSDAGSSGRLLIGDIGEVAIYNSALNTAQQTLVQNYISSKFDTPLAVAVDRYNGDLGGNGNFDYDVFGVGRVDASNQVLSGGMGGMGIEVASLATNDTWALAGHDNGPNGVTTNDVPPSSPWSQNKRWERSWFVDTNIVGTANLAFDWNDPLNSNTAPFDPTFDTLFRRAVNSGPFSIVATGIVDTINQRVDFSGITLQDGFYYTLGVSVIVPEPSTFALLGLGIVGMAVKARRRRRSVA